MDIMAYPRKASRLTELVTPLKPLEAMAQGRILIASDVGGHKELIRDGQTGYLFAADSEPALVSTVLRALADQAVWAQLRAAGRRFVEQERDWGFSTAGYVKPYTALTRRGHGQP